MIERTYISACPVCTGIPSSLGMSETYWLAPLGERVKVDFAVCQSCGFVFQSAPLTRGSLKAYYRESPRYRSAEVNAEEDGLRRAQLAFIERDGALDSKLVLDIGADMGKLLDLIAERGCTTAYMEDNEEARRHLNQHGRHREISEFAGSERFDLLILSQVFEHIVEPVVFMRATRRHLASDARVFIEVPCHSLWDDSEYGFSFEHVNYFSPSTLSQALQQAGFVVTRLEVCSDARYFRREVYDYQGDGASDRIAAIGKRRCGGAAPL